MHRIAGERAARAAIEQQAMLLEHITEAVFVIDAQGSITVWNRAAEEAFGWPREEVLGRSLAAVLPSVYGDGATLEDVLRRVAAAGRAKLEVLRQKRRGGWIEMEATVAALGDPGGGVAGYVSVNRDITMRKRAEAAVRASQERLAAILEAATEGIWVLGADGRTEFANRRAAEIFGFASADEILGRTFVQVVPALADVLEAEPAALLRGQTVRREVKHERPDGVATWLAYSRRHLRDAEGEVTGSVSLFTDVTDHRRAQDELQQAQKLEAVGRLAAGIAHEINTPIQYIGDNTHFLDEAIGAVLPLLQRYRAAAADGSLAAVREELERDAEALDVAYLVEEAPRVSARTLEGIQRVATIVRAMKEFAHPDQASQVAIDLNRALLATLEVSRNEYKYVADVTTDLGELPPVTCHPGELNQVFLNIVVNAAHAVADVVRATNGRGRIEVSTRAHGQEVVVAISDSGAGIPEAVRDKIFEPFFTTKEVGRGTGQGLAIARKIVASHGGQLSFTTTVGVGTTFHVRLPVTPPGSSAPAGAAHGASLA